MTRPRTRSPKGLFSRLLRERRGAVAIEFALTVPVLLVVMLGIVEFGRALWAQNALHYAVEEAARCATIDLTTCGNTSETQTYASTASGYGFATSVFTVTVAACGNQVSANYPFQFLTSFFGTGPTLTAQACFPT
jgi:Flp pilus assembly protein TadG